MSVGIYAIFILIVTNLPKHGSYAQQELLSMMLITRMLLLLGM